MPHNLLAAHQLSSLWFWSENLAITELSGPALESDNELHRRLQTAAAAGRDGWMSDKYNHHISPGDAAKTLLISTAKVTGEDVRSDGPAKLTRSRRGKELQELRYLQNRQLRPHKTTSLHCSKAEESLLHWGLSGWYQHKYTIIFRIPGREKDLTGPHPKYIENNDGQKDGYPCHLHPKSDKMQLFRRFFKRQIRDSSPSGWLFLHPAELTQAKSKITNELAKMNSCKNIPLPTFT